MLKSVIKPNHLHTHMTLYQHLSRFSRCSSLAELTDKFRELARHFIYGGYIRVNDVYRIYIRSVEFYYHDESNEPDAIKDPIMYHRNYPEEGINDEPYFPLMSICAHSSGYDITFENEKQNYRASALIREYSVYDIENKVFIRLTPKGELRDSRVRYLRYYLNGFSLQGKSDIIWVDEAHQQQKDLLQAARIRTAVIQDGKKTEVADDRPWRFKLDEDIWLPTD